MINGKLGHVVSKLYSLGRFPPPEPRNVKGVYNTVEPLLSGHPWGSR